MRTLIAVVIACLLAGPVLAQTNTTVVIRNAYAQESLTVSTAAVPFTVATYTLTGTSQVASRADFVVEGCAVRVWPTGTAPTATVGQKLNIGDVVTVFGATSVANFKAIRDTSCAVDATLQTVYSR